VEPPGDAGWTRPGRWAIDGRSEVTLPQTTHRVFVVDDEEFLEKLNDEELTAEELEAYAEDQSPNGFATSTETDLEVHRLLARLGVRWSEEVDVEDLDGVVKLVSAETIDDALARLTSLVGQPKAGARRIATILAEEFAAEIDDDAIDRARSVLEEQDARAEPEEDSELDVAAQVIVQHLHALRTAAEHGLWLVTASQSS
jgi:hypothetical protein